MTNEYKKNCKECGVECEVEEYELYKQQCPDCFFANLKEQVRGRDSKTWAVILVIAFIIALIAFYCLKQIGLV